jgi:hypothetical protein
MGTKLIKRTKISTLQGHNIMKQFFLDLKCNGSGEILLLVEIHSVGFLFLNV